MKIGKTTLAVQFPKNLLMAFEKGYNAIDNIMAVDIPNWAEFKKYVRQLADPDLQEQFNTITIDTVGLAYDRCSEYICAQQGVDKIGDIAFGAGYGMVDKEFDTVVRKITQLGYGLVLIGHEKVRVDSDGTISAKHISPDLPERCNKIVNRLVDITAYIGMEDGVRYIYPRQLNIDEGRQITEIYAGNHFPNLNEKIELGYKPFVDAIANAMETNAKAKKTKLVDTPVEVVEEEALDYKSIISEIKKIVKVLNKLDDESETPHFMEDYKKITEEYLGKGKLVKECTDTQVAQLDLILGDLKAYVAANGLTI